MVVAPRQDEQQGNQDVRYLEHCDGDRIDCGCTRRNAVLFFLLHLDYMADAYSDPIDGYS